jgi:hypothetical protein
LGARIFETAADSDQPEIRQETDEALTLTGKDVGTPIIQFQPPAGACGSGRSFGVETGQAGVQEEWYAGRRRARE